MKQLVLGKSTPTHTSKDRLHPRLQHVEELLQELGQSQHGLLHMLPLPFLVSLGHLRPMKVQGATMTHNSPI